MLWIFSSFSYELEVENSKSASRGMKSSSTVAGDEVASERSESEHRQRQLYLTRFEANRIAIILF